MNRIYERPHATYLPPNALLDFISRPKFCESGPDRYEIIYRYNQPRLKRSLAASAIGDVGAVQSGEVR